MTLTCEKLGEILIDVHQYVSRGGDVNLRDLTGKTALYHASFFAVATKQNKSVELLLKHGADPNIPDKDGRRALSIAVKSDRSELVTLLLENGGDPNLPDNLNRYPLLVAVKCKFLEIVDLLVQHGADVDNSDALCIALTQQERDVRLIQNLLQCAPNIQRSVPKIGYWEHDGRSFDTGFQISLYDYACCSTSVDMDGVTEVRTLDDDRIQRLMIYRLICDNVVAMHELQFSVYVLMWIFDFLPYVYEGISLYKKVTLIENLVKSLRKVAENSESRKKIKSMKNVD